MYEETREEVDDVQFGNLDAAVDQLIFARSKENDKEKMKRDPDSGSRLVSACYVSFSFQLIDTRRPLELCQFLKIMIHELKFFLPV